MIIEEEATEKSRACSVKVARGFRGELLVAPEFLARNVAGLASLVDIRIVLRADVMVHEVREEIADRDGGHLDHVFRFGVEVVREVGGSLELVSLQRLLVVTLTDNL